MNNSKSKIKLLGTLEEQLRNSKKLIVPILKIKIFIYSFQIISVRFLIGNLMFLQNLLAASDQLLSPQGKEDSPSMSLSRDEQLRPSWLPDPRRGALQSDPAE